MLIAVLNSWTLRVMYNMLCYMSASKRVIDLGLHQWELIDATSSVRGRYSVVGR